MSSWELLPLGAPFDTPTPHYGGQAQGPLQSESSIKSPMLKPFTELFAFPRTLSPPRRTEGRIEVYVEKVG